MDRIYRKLTSKTTGAPITNANVVARPVTSLDSSNDVLLVETPAGSGFYASASQQPHGTYRIIVNDVDSLDEVTVEPGRVKVKDRSGNPLYPTIDRALGAKMVASGVLGDTTSTMTSAQFVEAIRSVTDSDSLHRQLVLDMDVSLDSAHSLNGPLFLDLNGRTLTLNASLTGAYPVRISNGTIAVPVMGPTIYGSDATFINVKVTGAGVYGFVQSSTSQAPRIQTFVACEGLPALDGAEDSSKSVARVCGGDHGFATADQLKLTNDGSVRGAGRLGRLQAWIDTKFEWAEPLLTWLSSAKSALQVWVDMGATKRNALAATTGYDGARTRWYPEFQFSKYLSSAYTWLAMPSWVYKLGINCGAKVITDARGQITYAKIVAIGQWVQFGQGQDILIGGAEGNYFPELAAFIDECQIADASTSGTPRRAVLKAYKITTATPAATKVNVSNADVIYWTADSDSFRLTGVQSGTLGDYYAICLEVMATGNANEPTLDVA